MSTVEYTFFTIVHCSFSCQITKRPLIDNRTLGVVSIRRQYYELEHFLRPRSMIKCHGN